MIIDKKEGFVYNFIFLIGLIIVPSLVTGPFVADLIVSLSSIFFIYLLYKKKVKIYLNSFYIKLSIIWFIYIILNSLFSSNILISLESSLFYIRFFLFSLLILYFIKKNQKYLIYTFNIILITMCILIFDSFFQYIFDYNLIGFNKHVRVTSFFYKEEVLGGYLSRLFPYFLSIYLFINNQKIKNNYFTLIIFYALLIISIFIAGERSGVVYVFISSLLIFFLLDLKKIQLIAVVITIFLYILINQINNSSFERIINYSILQLTEKTERLSIFSVQHETLYFTSFKMFKDHIFFGIGPKNYRHFCNKEEYITTSAIDPTFSSCQTHPHNYYLQVLSETGIIGFILLLILYFRVCYEIIINFVHKYYKKIKTKNFSLLCLYICFFTYFFPFIPTGSFFNNWLSILNYLPLGFFIYLTKIDLIKINE